MQEAATKEKAVMATKLFFFFFVLCIQEVSTKEARVRTERTTESKEDGKEREETLSFHTIVPHFVFVGLYVRETNRCDPHCMYTGAKLCNECKLAGR